MPCGHQDASRVTGRRFRDGGWSQQCQDCKLRQRVSSDGVPFGEWFNYHRYVRATATSPPRGAVESWPASEDWGARPAPAQQVTPVAVPASMVVTPEERVFSAEIVSIARQLSDAQAAVDVLAMRLNRAVESYNSAQTRTVVA